VNLAQAEEHLLSLELFGMRFGLERMRRLLTALGSPQERFGAVHVVGTNGKSSTVRITAAILRRHGLRVGAYLSPHLVTFAERVRVDDQDVSGAEFAAAVQRAAAAAAKVDRTAEPDDHVTQFELLTAAAFDLFAACTGFVFGLGIGRAVVGSGVAGTVLVLGVETLSRIVDYTDRNTCVLFGDGAGAVILRPCEPGVGLHAVEMHSDGELGEVLEVPAGISRNPASDDTVARHEHFIRMQGKKLYPFAVRSMEESTRRCLEKTGWEASDIDLLVPHQANVRIIEAVGERLGLRPEQVVVNIERYGNTSSASIPLALNEARDTGRLKPGMTVVLVGFGAGFTWGSMVIKW